VYPIVDSGVTITYYDRLLQHRGILIHRATLLLAVRFGASRARLVSEPQNFVVAANWTEYCTPKRSIADSGLRTAEPDTQSYQSITDAETVFGRPY